MFIVGCIRVTNYLSQTESMKCNCYIWCGFFQCVLKEGTLNRTKITENGKKLRKNWAPAHVVLTELFLLFFKDAKTFEAMVCMVLFKNPVCT